MVNDLKWSKFIKYLNISQGLWIHFTWESIILCKDISGMPYQIWIYAFQMMFWVALPYSSSFKVCYDAKFCAFQYVTTFSAFQYVTNFTQNSNWRLLFKGYYSRKKGCEPPGSIHLLLQGSTFHSCWYRCWICIQVSCTTLRYCT